MKTVKLSDITLNITDGKHGDCEPDAKSGFYFISCKDVNNGRIDYENARQISEASFREAHIRTQLAPNDILLTNSGTIGRMAIVKDIPETYRTTFQKSVAIIKPDAEKIIPSYLYYQLQNCVADFINRSNGSAQKNLLLSTMRAFDLTIHEDFETQQRLSDILSAYDDLIENNQKQIKLLEEAAQRLYKEWFVDLRFPGYETTPIVDGVPEGWAQSDLDSICSVRKDTLAPSDIFGGMPYIGLEHMPRNDICLYNWGDASDVASNKYSYQENDVLFGKIRPYFHKVGFALNSGVASTDSIIMRAHDGLWGLLLMTASSDAFVDYTYQTCKEGSKMPRADWTQMKQYPVLVANDSVREQFEDNVKQITKRIKALALQNRLLAEARDHLLPKLMDGELI